ncbi:MAG: hypothetical protein SGPRY_006923 [Prymnesium sp.]
MGASSSCGCSPMEVEAELSFHPAADGTFSSKYSLLSRVADGEFAEVWVGKAKRTDEDIAVKLTKQKHAMARAFVELREAILDQKFTLIVMELLKGGELFDHILQRGQLTEDDCRSVTRDIVGALAYLHSRGVVHRDVKPDNCLFTEPPDPSQPLPRLKLCDFGLARFMPTNDLQGPMLTVCGTPGYAAPELVGGNGSYGGQCDMWAAGVLLYEALSGRCPFDTRQLGKDFRNLHWSFAPKDFRRVSLDAMDLIKRLIVTQPKKRLSAEQVVVNLVGSGGSMTDA